MVFNVRGSHTTKISAEIFSSFALQTYQIRWNIWELRKWREMLEMRCWRCGSRNWNSYLEHCLRNTPWYSSSSNMMVGRQTLASFLVGFGLFSRPSCFSLRECSIFFWWTHSPDKIWGIHMNMNYGLFFCWKPLFLEPEYHCQYILVFLMHINAFRNEPTSKHFLRRWPLNISWDSAVNRGSFHSQRKILTFGGWLEDVDLTGCPYTEACARDGDSRGWGSCAIGNGRESFKGRDAGTPQELKWEVDDQTLEV